MDPPRRHDAGHAFGGQRNVAQQHTCVHGHVVHALLALLNDGVAVQLPRQCGRVTVDLLQCLIDRHRAHGHRRVTQQPLAGQVDVAAGGQVHDGVRAPAGGPHHLVDLFGDRAGHCRIANVRIDGLGTVTLAVFLESNERSRLAGFTVTGPHGLPQPAPREFQTVIVRRIITGPCRNIARALGELYAVCNAVFKIIFVEDAHPSYAEFGFLACQFQPAKLRRIERYMADGLAQGARRKIEILQRFADKDPGRVDTRR